MTFFSVLLALIFEQMRVLSPRNIMVSLLQRHIAAVGKLNHLEQNTAGVESSRRGMLLWLSIVLPWTLAVGLIHYVLYRINPALAFVWNVVVLYFTLGLRQFSHSFTAIHLALKHDDVLRARELLHEWADIDTVDMSVDDIVRHALIQAIVSAHRCVFGVLFWFCLPIGPAGAVLYRVSGYLMQIDEVKPISAEPLSRSIMPCAEFSRRVFVWLDWIPVQLTAFSFAVVGNFEDAVHAWRNAVKQWRVSKSQNAVLLAAASGALGVSLLDPTPESSSIEVLALNAMDMPYESLPEMSSSAPLRVLQSAMGLIWRAAVLWMVSLAALTVAVWTG
jgi:adenosylcobinamide-phosphate synthase